MKAGGGLTTQRMVELGRVSRSSFYRFDPGAKPTADRDMEWRDAIQHIALEWPCYGGRASPPSCAARAGR